jgi:anti-sigma regulatory factor (Ser/Thr protein kinase)
MSPSDNPEGTLPRPASSSRPLSRRPVHRAPWSESRRALRLELPADSIAPSVARDRVRYWLTALCWPAGQRDDIVLAVSEAVSNAIEHAYLDQPSGLVEIRSGVETTPGGQRRVTVIVRDHGHWRPVPVHDENRRRGIPLMRACMDTVTIGQPSDDQAGTCVVLRSRAVPPLSQALAAPDRKGNEA